MENLKEYYTLEQVVAACDGRTNDALVLIEFIEEGWYLPPYYYFPVIFEFLQEDVKVHRSEFLDVFRRLESRFDIKRKPFRSEPDEETQTRFGFDLQLVITLIDLYSNV